MSHVGERTLLLSTLQVRNFLRLIFVAFPEECDRVDGPHSLQCLLAIYEQTECVEDGSAHPINVDTFQLDIYTAFHIT